MDFDAGEGRVERRDPQVGQTGRGGADQHDAVFQLRGLGVSRQHVGGRDIRERRALPIGNVDLAAGIDRHLEPADFQPGLAIGNAQNRSLVLARRQRIAAQGRAQGFNAQCAIAAP